MLRTVGCSVYTLAYHLHLLRLPCWGLSVSVPALVSISRSYVGIYALPNLMRDSKREGRKNGLSTSNFGLHFLFLRNLHLSLEVLYVKMVKLEQKLKNWHQKAKLAQVCQKAKWVQLKELTSCIVGWPGTDLRLTGRSVVSSWWFSQGCSPSEWHRSWSGAGVQAEQEVAGPPEWSRRLPGLLTISSRPTSRGRVKGKPRREEDDLSTSPTESKWERGKKS